MAQIHAEASAFVDAPPGDVYAILADYREGHPKILPEKYFLSCEVLQGGTGAGTRIRVRMRAAGTTQTLHMEISEPEPGRRMVETTEETGAVTTFTVEPAQGRTGSLVAISTAYSKPGIGGFIEHFVVPPLLRRIYAEELEKLEQVAGERTGYLHDD